MALMLGRHHAQFDFEEDLDDAEAPTTDAAAIIAVGMMRLVITAVAACKTSLVERSRRTAIRVRVVLRQTVVLEAVADVISPGLLRG
jgi:hypothetical protein